jgi:hypothetical protein
MSMRLIRGIIDTQIAMTFHPLDWPMERQLRARLDVEEMVSQWINCCSDDMIIKRIIMK